MAWGTLPSFLWPCITRELPGSGHCVWDSEQKEELGQTGQGWDEGHTPEAPTFKVFALRWCMFPCTALRASISLNLGHCEPLMPHPSQRAGNCPVLLLSSDIISVPEAPLAGVCLCLSPVSWQPFPMVKVMGRGVSLCVAGRSGESILLCESEEHSHVFKMQTSCVCQKHMIWGALLEAANFAYLPYLLGPGCIKFVNFIKSHAHYGITRNTEEPK